MKPLMAGLLVVTLGLAVAPRAQAGPATAHPAAGVVHSAPPDAHPAAKDVHPAKADPHPAVSTEIHPASPGYVPAATIGFTVAPRTGDENENSIVTTTPAPAETFSVPTFIETPATPSTTSTNQIGQ